MVKEHAYVHLQHLARTLLTSAVKGKGIALVFFYIIKTVKMYLFDIKGYLTYVYHEIMSGNKNYETLMKSVVSC